MEERYSKFEKKCIYSKPDRKIPQSASTTFINATELERKNQQYAEKVEPFLLTGTRFPCKI
ncbi:hypothetical protein [Pygmaiobacter massiliensis]|uniref:hypothetical protein n=1 Tax=Pygmaiobacter massiliensis TaxID=1917873 RepID=UPI000C7B0225|nr:hypothetical protein [Pygmaiobacter massiliensis]